MFSELSKYCQWNWLEKIRELLDENPGIDITQDDGMCVRLAISHNSSEMLNVLLEYFRDSLHSDQMLHASAMHKMADVFEEHIDFEDLSTEIRAIIREFLPSIAEKGLIEAASAGHIEVVKELYKDFSDANEDVLSAATSCEQGKVIDAIANMAPTIKKKAMTFCDAADSYVKYGKLEKAHEFYEKAISVDPSHITSYLHCANSIVAHLCTYGAFSAEAAMEAEEHYKTVIEYNPKYSCAYKKLGILYQKWSKHDLAHKQELEVKAFESYVKAVECKNASIKYDALYIEITHLGQSNIDDIKVQKIIDVSTYNDSRLQGIIVGLRLAAKQSTDTSDEVVSSLAEEDIEYEESDMDQDLDLDSLSTLSLAGETHELFDAVDHGFVE